MKPGNAALGSPARAGMNLLVRQRHTPGRCRAADRLDRVRVISRVGLPSRS